MYSEPTAQMTSSGAACASASSAACAGSAQTVTGFPNRFRYAPSSAAGNARGERGVAAMYAAACPSSAANMAG